MLPIQILLQMVCISYREDCFDMDKIDTMGHYLPIKNCQRARTSESILGLWVREVQYFMLHYIDGPFSPPDLKYQNSINIFCKH